MEIHSSGKSGSLSRIPDLAVVSGIESPRELSSGKRALCKSHLIGTIALEAYRHNTCVLIGRCRNKLSPVPECVYPRRKRKDLLTLVASLEHLSPLYRQELSTILPEAFQPGGPSTAANEEYHRLFESVAQVIRILSNTSAVVLILEDLHWADDKTLELMAFLSRRIKTARVLFIGTAQEEELESAPKRRITQDLEHEDRLSSMRLSSLSSAETAELVKRLARVGITKTYSIDWPNRYGQSVRAIHFLLWRCCAIFKKRKHHQLWILEMHLCLSEFEIYSSGGSND